ncbi:MAG: hypothetical protein HDR50_04655 [Desulfovibrio sp.]|uniref:hypothetical protein n=1 Tax=Desulfovibrio sp. TaxID=885 RepID=UPI001A7B193C|nr:hypothetical protein [Desulfovibrio sp.]MBD5416945.1 hypothetical protein [Desulfovibrio sp.]
MLDVIERQLIEAEKDLALYSSAPISVLSGALFAMLGLMPAYLSSDIKHLGLYFTCIFMIGFIAILCYIYSKCKLNNDIIPKIVRLRTEKMKLEYEMFKAHP